MVRALSVALWLGLLACGESARTFCYDRDGDGFGAGCGRGADCDDADPLRTTDCSDASVSSELCELAETAPGCPCLKAARAICFPGPMERADVGLCRAGRAQCRDGRWSECEGAVAPELEICNSADDDCDGFVDEGVESPCGGCDVACQGGVWGSRAAPFEAEAPLALTAAQELTLAWQSSAATVLWVPNTDEGTISKIDAVSTRELARYRTRGGYPIQAAVDHRGDAFVLDGTFGGAAHLSKIAADTRRCRGAHTSGAPDDVLPLGEDDCVLIELPLSASDDPRTLSVDGALAPDSERAGDVWVGCAGSAELLHLAGDDGAELGRYPLSVRAHASAFERFGGLWLIERAGRLLRFDPRARLADEPIRVPLACFSLDAFSVDVQGRLLLSGAGCERVHLFDPQRAQWRSAPTPDLLSPRGIVAHSDGSWVSYSSGQIAQLVPDTLQPLAAKPLATGVLRPFETTMLTADGLGQLWAISAQGGPQQVGLATRFDPKTGEVSGQVPVGRGPRAGGDFSGSASGGEFARAGRAVHVFAGCGREGRAADAVSQGATQWLNLSVVALLGAGASVGVSVRHAEREASLSEAAFTPLGVLPEDSSPFALSLPDGGVIEVALDLASRHAIGAPRIVRVGVQWRCPGPE